VITLETARLRLSMLGPEDAAFIVQLLNEPSFLLQIGDRGVRTVDDARGYIAHGPADSYQRHGFGLQLVRRKRGGEAIGMCGLLKRDELRDPDLGFAYLPAYWGQGYAVEAGRAVLADAWERLRLPRLAAITAPGNSGSIAVLERLGFALEGVLQPLPESPPLNLFGMAAPVEALADRDWKRSRRG
jgi:[ribosomal protein S5]-alanine N-acetyltransferase